MVDPYAAVRAEAPPDVLSQMSLLAKELLDIEQNILPEIKRQAEVAAARGVDIAERLLPELFDQVGLADFTTDTGVKVSLVNALRASISAERKSGAIEWLENNGYAGMVTNEVVVGFSKTNEEEARKLLKELAPKFGNVKMEKDVNTTSVKAMISERLADKLEVPLEVFGAKAYRTVKLGVKKK